MMMKTIVTAIVLAVFSVAIAQSDVEELYLRKAVKEFVAKNYETAIENLEQVLIANRQNVKAKKLMAKCFVNKANQLGASGQIVLATQAYQKALEYDPQNPDAVSGVHSITSLAPEQPSTPRQAGPPQQQVQQPVQQYQPQAVAPVQYQPATPQQAVAPPQQNQQLEQAVISAALQGGRADSAQLRIVSKLLDNFKQQQDMMAQQMATSNKMMMNTQTSKDEYLKMMLTSSEQKSDMLKQFFLIAGLVILGIVVLVFLLLVFVFHRFSKSTELRTIQATDAITALLAAPQATQQAPLLLTTGSLGAGPGAAPGGTISVDILNAVDPIQRANAVEVVAAEIIEPEKNSRVEKIKKLEELLHDENNRVRANAAKALYEIDKEASLKTLRDMVRCDSKRMIASAIWALGEISSEDALQVILSVDPKDDEIIKFNKKSALEKVKSLKRFSISKEQQDLIEEHLKLCSDAPVFESGRPRENP